MCCFFLCWLSLEGDTLFKKLFFLNICFAKSIFKIPKNKNKKKSKLKNANIEIQFFIRISTKLNQCCLVIVRHDSCHRSNFLRIKVFYGACVS